MLPPFRWKFFEELEDKCQEVAKLFHLPGGKYGIKTPGNIADRIVHTYENVVVVTDKLIKEVITTYTTGH